LRCAEQVSNGIDGQGCKHLKGAPWPRLTAIDLGRGASQSGDNAVREEGCLWLIKADWKQLDYLDLCRAA
jgi:hypothetical protein